MNQDEKSILSDGGNTRTDEAVMRHSRGYNCAQAVACTYADLVGCEEVLLFKAAEGFGLGMGCMEGTCGAVSGACLLAGMKNSAGDMERSASKGATGKLSRAISQEFLRKNGSLRCRDLKGDRKSVV